ncbi:mCG9747, isoform CRA_d [Mus musculus]|nr:mCG9747, isoform CRA_d [Mus musculus]
MKALAPAATTVCAGWTTAPPGSLAQNAACGLCARSSRLSVSPFGHRPGMQCAVTTPPPSFYPYPNLRWDTSHFKKTGGSQRNNYVVHPEFVSETCPVYPS